MAVTTDRLSLGRYLNLCWIRIRLDPDPAGSHVLGSGPDSDPAGSNISGSGVDPDPAGSENYGSGAHLPPIGQNTQLNVQ